MIEFDNHCRIGETMPGREGYDIRQPQGTLFDTWYAQPGLYCLQPGKQTYTSVDQAQQVDSRNTDAANKKGFLRCAECQHPITRNIERIEINEKHHHVFANPHGYIYRIGCFAHAPGCIAVGEEFSHFSWFPGHTWQIALCGRCLTLLGWAFRSRESRFFGLILKKLLQGKNYE